MKLISKFQEGGAMPPQGGAPAPQGGEDPMAMLMQGAQQALEGQDCQVAMQVCQMLLELAGGGAQGGAPGPESCPSSSRRRACLSQRRTPCKTY